MTDKIIQHSRRNKDKIMAETTTKKDVVLQALKDAPDPMTAPMLVAYTDLDIKAVRGALATLKAAGHAKTVSRGHYVAVKAKARTAAEKPAEAPKKAKSNGGPKMEFKVVAIATDGSIVLKNADGVWKAEQVF